MKTRTWVRGAAILAALAVLPACHDWYELDDHTLRVFNNSPDDVVVEVWVDEYWGRDHDVFLVPAGSEGRAHYHEVYDMDVRITRQFDGLLLFTGSFDHRDFEHDGDTVEIFIGP